LIYTPCFVPPLRQSLTVTVFPYTTLFRSGVILWEPPVLASVPLARDISGLPPSTARNVLPRLSAGSHSFLPPDEEAGHWQRATDQRDQRIEDDTRQSDDLSRMQGQ